MEPNYFPLDTQRCFCKDCQGGCNEHFSQCIRGVCVCFDNFIELPDNRCHHNGKQKNLYFLDWLHLHTFSGSEFNHYDQNSTCPIMCQPHHQSEHESCENGVCRCISNGQIMPPYITYDGKLAPMTHSRQCPEVRMCLCMQLFKLRIPEQCVHFVAFRLSRMKMKSLWLCSQLEAFCYWELLQCFWFMLSKDSKIKEDLG